MRRILISFAIIAAIGAVVVSATTAFFSDTETSTGNTFTAGSIDLKIDSQAHYNNMVCVDGTWQAEAGFTPLAGHYPVPGSECVTTWGQTEPGVDITSEKFFNYNDLKPGDFGENTVSLHVIDNDAWLCAEVSALTSDDNGLTEPEALVDTTDGIGNGELDDAMLWTIWRDDGDNIQQTDEPTILSGHPVNGVLALYDSSTGPIVGGTTGYLGVAWSLPGATTGNEVQTDSLSANIIFTAEQARNNPNFVCGSQQQEPESFQLTIASTQNALNEVSQDKPWYTYEIDGLCIDFTLHNPTYSPAYFDFAIDGNLGTNIPGLSDILISEGPLNGQLVGNLYDDVSVAAGQTTNVQKCGTNEIKMGIHYGAEQLWYLDWATFTAS